MALNMSYVHEFVCRGRFRGRGLESITRLWSRNRRRVNKAGTRNPRAPLPLRTHLDECEDFESCASAELLGHVACWAGDRLSYRPIGGRPVPTSLIGLQVINFFT